MTEHDKNHEDRLEIKWVYVLIFIFMLFLWGYASLENHASRLDQTKLDKSVFEEHQLSIGAMKSDISRIRDILEQHATHFKPDR